MTALQWLGVLTFGVFVTIALLDAAWWLKAPLGLLAVVSFYLAEHEERRQRLASEDAD